MRIDKTGHEVNFPGKPGLYTHTWALRGSPSPQQARPRFQSRDADGRSAKGTIRCRLRISQDGRELRLRLSIEYGDSPLALRAVSVALPNRV
jgi:hypothetical protein